MTGKLYAHQIIPEPVGNAPIRERARYHIARAQGYWLAVLDSDDRDIQTALRHAIPETHLALLYYALHHGNPPAAAADWVAQQLDSPDDLGEWLPEYGAELGVDMDSIKPYLLPRSGGAA